MGEYVDAGGVRTYYEEWGRGEPVLLLHGGGVTADSWHGQAPDLARHYRVLAPERRGHGRTPDAEGPFSYAAMADDTAAFAEALGLGPARVVGWSDGGNVATHLALRRPDLVSKLVLIGAGVALEGASADAGVLVDGSEESRALLTGMFQGPYAALSPDGADHFPVVLDKLVALWREGPGLTLEDLHRIGVPVLVLQGDHDGVTVEHSAAMVRALPDAQLAVVPGASHAVPVEKPWLVNRMLLDFLGEPRTPLLFPLS